MIKDIVKSFASTIKSCNQHIQDEIERIESDEVQTSQTEREVNALIAHCADN